MNVTLISFYNRFKEYSTRYSLGTLKLAAYIGKNENIEVTIIPISSDQELMQETLEKLSSPKIDILGIPNYMWTESLAKQISRYVSKKNPKILKIIGGPNTPSVDFSEWNSDEIFIIGEGEEALYQICKARLSNPKFTAIDVAILPTKNVFSEKHNLDNRHILYTNTQIPNGLPLFSDEIEKMKLDKTPENFAWYETTRGCSYNCGYCGHKTRNNLGNISLETIQEEIRNIGKRGIKRLFIVDPIIGGKPLKGKEILKLCNHHIPDTQIIAYLRPEMLDDEFITILKNCNLEEMRFGIQTLNPNVPGWVRSNSINVITRELSKLKNERVNWRAELIVGLPGDNMEGLRNSMKVVVNDFQPTVLAAYHLTAIKGTKLYSLVDGSNKDKTQWLRVNDNSQAIASYSYTEEEFCEMARYSNGITSLYNLLKRYYPTRTVDYDKLEKFVFKFWSDVDQEKIMEFDDEYMEQYWQGKLKELIHEEVNNSQTWSVREQSEEDYSRDDH